MWLVELPLAVPGDPHDWQVNPGGGCPSQFAHRAVSCQNAWPKIVGQALDLLGGEAALPVAAVAFGVAHGGVAPMAWVHPLRWRRTRMFAPTTAAWASGISPAR